MEKDQATASTLAAVAFAGFLYVVVVVVFGRFVVVVVVLLLVYGLHCIYCNC